MGGRAALRQSARTVAFVLPSFAGGGAERVVLTLAAHLDRDRFLPTVVVLDGRGPLKQAVPARLEVHDLGRSRLRWAVPRLARVLRRLRPAAIVSTLGHLNLAVLALRPILPPGTRILAREANTPAQSLATVPRPALFRAAYRRLYPGADAVICPSRRIADEMVRDFSVPAGRVRVLPNPVDVDGIRAAAKPPRGERGPGPRFVAAGRLTVQKGFDRLIEMFARLDAAARLTILGEGPEEAALRALADRLGVGRRVTFAGFDPVPWAAYAGADAFLLSSRWEGMSNAALEALACGTPVIATPEAGGIAEVAIHAPSGSVTVAESGAPFAAAVSAVAPAPPETPRPSLLPPGFVLAAAIDRFTDLLEASCRSPVEGGR